MDVAERRDTLGLMECARRSVVHVVTVQCTVGHPIRRETIHDDVPTLPSFPLARYLAGLPFLLACQPFRSPAGLLARPTSDYQRWAAQQHKDLPRW